MFANYTVISSVWRPLEYPVTDWPIAVCDGRTVSPSDLVEADHVRRQYTGSTMYLQHNPAQKFYYLDNQTKDEILIFKNFDSARNVAAKCERNCLSYIVFTELQPCTLRMTALLNDAMSQMHRMLPFSIQTRPIMDILERALKLGLLYSHIQKHKVGVWAADYNETCG